MKTLVIICTVLATFATAPKTQELTIEATYVGFEEGIYVFVDDEAEYQFVDINARASKKFQLNSDEFIGKRFKVTYDTDTEVDENDEEYDVFIIIDLDLID